MPLIPTYDAKDGLDPDQAPQVQFNKAQFQAQAAQGAALQGLGSSITELGAHMEQRQEQKDAFTAQIGLQNLQQTIKQGDQQAQSSIAADGSGWADGRLQAAREASNSFLDTITNPKIREQYQQRLALMQNDLHTEYAGQQLGQQNQFFKQGISTMATNAGNAVLNDPSQLEAQTAQLKTLIANAGTIPILERQQLEKQLDSQLQMAYIYGLSRKDPNAAQAALGVAPRPGQPGSPGTAPPGVPSAAQQGGVGSDAAASAQSPGVVNTAFSAPNLEKAPDAVSTSSREGQAMSFFQSQGWTPAQASGIVGNLIHESALKTGARNVGDGSDGSDSIGLAQWNGARAQNLKAFAASQGKDWHDFGTQLAFVQRELITDHSAAGAALRNATDPRAATAAMVLNFERPAGSETGDATKTNGWGYRLAAAQRLAGGDYSNISDVGHSTFLAAPPDPRLADIPFEKRLALATDIARSQKMQAAQAAAQQTADHADFMNQFQIGIHDGKLGVADIQAARTSGQLTDYDDIHKLETQIASQDKQTGDLQNFGQALGNPNFSWNPLNPDHRSMVDAGYAQLAQKEGPASAIQHVVEKTGILPSDAGVALRGALVQDPAKAQNALQAGSSLLRQNPNVFAGMKDGDGFADKVATFNHYVNDLGFDAGTASQKIFQQQQPEYQQQVKVRLNGQDEDKIVKDNLAPVDLAKAFNDGTPYFGRPAVGANPVVQQAAMGDYTELFKQNFEQNGDVDLSKNLAIDQMKRIWGVSHVTSSGILTRYPIDKAPVYAGIENAPDRIAEQMVAQIKKETGQDVDRKQLSLAAVSGPTGDTAAAFKDVRPVPVSLGWSDDHGILHVLRAPFAPDPVAMRNQQTIDRQTAFGRAQTLNSQVNDTLVNTPMGSLDER